ncbi:MAG: hypothetical protein SOX24_02170 [Candidatus Enterosoma sp.]|nr:hypothetical protein [Candidatus Enterosoma sp.]
MKKLKKSAVVIPALARIAVTAAASVSGTVAWFTANRSVTVKGSNFNAVAQDGDLSIKLGDVLVGVVADGTTGSVKMADKTSLTDASYNTTSSELYTKILGENEKNETVVTGYEDLGTATVTDTEGVVGAVKSNPDWFYVNGSNNDKTTVYYGVSWTWNFTYVFKSDANDMGLFFNIKDSTIGITNKDSDGDKNRNGTEYTNSAHKVGQGFRLARQAEQDTDNKNENQTIVWAPQGGKNSRVIGTEATATHEFDTGIFHTVGETNASTATDLATDYKTKNSNNGYCFLGRLTSTATTISVKCTAWFEGTDDNVVNDALNQVVTTTQRFYVRKLAKIK